MEKNEPITLVGEGHSAIVLESVNAIEEDNGWRTVDGRSICKAQWEDDEDVRVYLTAYRDVDTKANQNTYEGMWKPRTAYYLLRQSSMPGFVEQKFYFTSRYHEGKVWLCDMDDKKTLPKSHAEHLEYMNVVINALRQRPSRQDTDGSIRLFALDTIMASENVKKMIARLDDGTRNSIGIDMILDYVLNNEPILSKDKDMIESYIKDMHMCHIANSPTSDSM